MLDWWCLGNSGHVLVVAVAVVVDGNVLMMAVGVFVVMVKKKRLKWTRKREIVDVSWEGMFWVVSSFCLSDCVVSSRFPCPFCF